MEIKVGRARINVEFPNTQFKVNEVVRTLDGHVGKIIMIQREGHINKYLLDLYPGAEGGYNWVWLNDENGKTHLYAANWFEELQISEVV